MIEKPNVKPTVERLYLEHESFHGTQTVQRHLARYKWAASHLAGVKRLLHAGCGSGYGDFVLASKVGSIVSVDKCKEAIEYAEWMRRATSPSCPIDYAVADLAKLEGIDGLFDAAVCIEVIEHLTEDEQGQFMAQLKRVLVPTGRLLITTPLKSPDGQKMTEFHQHEFTATEFESFLRRHFKNVVFDDPVLYGIPMAFMLGVCDGVAS